MEIKSSLRSLQDPLHDPTLGQTNTHQVLMSSSIKVQMTYRNIPLLMHFSSTHSRYMSHSLIFFDFIILILSSKE